MTLVFSANQALLAALAGATYVSPFVGRLDDAGHDGMEVVRDAVEIIDRYHLPYAGHSRQPAPSPARDRRGQVRVAHRHLALSGVHGYAQASSD